MVLHDWYCENCQVLYEAFDSKCKTCGSVGIKQLSAPRIINGGQYYSGNSISGLKPLNRSKRFSK